MKLLSAARIPDQIRAWAVELFAAAIRNVGRPEDREAAIDWLSRSRAVIAGEGTTVEKAKHLNALIDSRATARALAASVKKTFSNYRRSRLPLSVKVALPATLAALPFVGGQAAGIAAFGGAVGAPVALLLFLGVSGITAIIEAVVTDPAARVEIAAVIGAIIEDERLRRTTSAMKQAMQAEPANACRFVVPDGAAELHARLVAMDPFDFERHVMSFFRDAGLEAWATRRTNDFGVDGFAVHADGLIIVQCKRNAPANRVGRPTVQQFKGVAEEQNAVRGYIVTTSRFTDEAAASAALTDRIRLIDMSGLAHWHRSAPTEF